MPYKDLERQRVYAREWIKRNAQKAREAMRRWRAGHPDERNADRRAFYQRHRAAELAQSARYHRDHPEVGLARSQNYRARKQAALGSFTPAEWLALVERYGGRCAYCGERGALEADHRVPLSRGGANTIDNIRPVCRACNARKHRMTEEEFRARLASERGDNFQSTS